MLTMYDMSKQGCLGFEVGGEHCFAHDFVLQIYQRCMQHAVVTRTHASPALEEPRHKPEEHSEGEVGQS